MRLDKMLKKVKVIIKKHSENSEIITEKIIERMAIEICLYIYEFQFKDGKNILEKLFKMIPDIFKDDKKKGKK